VILHAVSRGNLSLTKSSASFSTTATQVTAGDSRWQGKTSEDYWALSVPVRRGYGCDHSCGRLIDHPATGRRSAGADRQFLRGDHGRRVRSRRPPGQGQPLVAALVRRADARVAARWRRLPQPCSPARTSWSHQPVERRRAKPFDQIQPFPKIKPTGPTSNDFRFGSPKAIRISAARKGCRASSAYSKLLDASTGCRGRSTRCR